MRPRRIGPSILLGLLLAGLPPAGVWGAVAASDRTAGEGVAAAKGCGVCHALPGEPQAKKPGPAFLAPAPPQAASEVMRRLWNHIPGMRQHFVARGLAWPAISVPEMADLLTFLGMRAGRERAPNLDRGRVLLVQKGCLKCHTLAGEGGRIAPDLMRFREYGNPIPLAAALWNKAPGMLERIDKSGIPFPIFQEGEMGDLLGFLGAVVDVSH